MSLLPALMALDLCVRILAWWQRILSAIPLFYWHVGGEPDRTKHLIGPH